MHNLTIMKKGQTGKTQVAVTIVLHSCSIYVEEKVNKSINFKKEVKGSVTKP